MSEQILNENIKSPIVILITQDGINKGKFLTKMALQMAKESGLDLVQVSPSINNNPPVVKILDFNKLKYKQKKNVKHSKSSSNETKEIKFSPNIAEHDLNIKAKKVMEFLTKKHKVKIVLEVKNRHNFNNQEGIDKILNFLAKFSDLATWTNPTPSVIGPRNINCLLTPKS